MKNPCRTKCPKICIIGDSTVTKVAYYLKQIRYCRINNLATPGDSTAAQRTKWENLTAAEKLTFDFVFVQTGVNDYSMDSVYSIPAYQSFLNLIRSEISDDAVIYGCTMTPVRESDQGDESTGYPRWLALNAAIRGEGATPISGFDSILTSHTTEMKDANDVILVGYNNNPTHFVIGDKLHPNIAGNTLNAQKYADLLNL